MPIILVTVLLPWWNTTTKVTYKRKHLIGCLLTVSEGWFLIITAWSVVAGRKVWCWSNSEGLYTDPQAKREKRHLAWTFETFKCTPSVTQLLHMGHTSPSFPNSSINWEWNIQTWALEGHVHLNYHTTVFMNFAEKKIVTMVYTDNSCLLC